VLPAPFAPRLRAHWGAQRRAVQGLAGSAAPLIRFVRLRPSGAFACLSLTSQAVAIQRARAVGLPKVRGVRVRVVRDVSWLAVLGLIGECVMPVTDPGARATPSP
jgi:hypothetical protein